jgi:AcrR family transcriptional regulator
MSRADQSTEGNTPERIMRATHCALCEHGYASLTMKNIAAESDLSKAALHYHYDSKTDLLHSFLDYLLESFRSRADEATADGDDPFDRVRSLVELLFDPPERDPGAEFRTALLELKAQAPYEPPVRERLVAFDTYLRDRLTTELRAARENGTLGEDTDPEVVAEFVVGVANGAHTRRVALGRHTDAVEDHLFDYLDDLMRTGDKR